MSAGSMDELIVAKASRPGGASRQQLTANLVGAKLRRLAGQRFEALLADGSLLMFSRAPVGGRGRNAEQYFTDQVEGEKWASCTAPALRQQKRKVKPNYKPAALTISEKRVKATWPALDADAPVIVPANVKRTVAPTHHFDARYQIDPSTRVVGGFATLGPGRYLEDARP